MKGLRRSIISSSAIWISYVVFLYIVLVRGVFQAGRLDYLIFGRDGRNLIFSIFYGTGFIIFTALLYKRALLPCYEVFIRKQIIDKTTRIDWFRAESSAPYLPWTSMTILRISNERGLFTYPDSLPEDIKDHKVHIRFLKRSELVLEISIVE